jgi:hypothetical protein
LATAASAECEYGERGSFWLSHDARGYLGAPDRRYPGASYARLGPYGIEVWTAPRILRPYIFVFPTCSSDTLWSQFGILCNDATVSNAAAVRGAEHLVPGE